MDVLSIKGGNKLVGEISVNSAKNAILPLLAATVMVDGEVAFTHCKPIKDVVIMLEILKSLGGEYRFDGDTLYVDSTGVYFSELPLELTSKIRASVFLLGPLLARFHKATMCLPGGCNLGERPIDIHIDGLRKMGVEICGESFVYCRTDNLTGAKIKLKFPSVGATENLIMASTLASGFTVIENAAREPEIESLSDFLNLCGAKIMGAGTNTVYIEGVKKLYSPDLFKPVCDRIEIGTYMLFALATGGELCIDNANLKYCQSIIEKVRNNACNLYAFNDKIYIRSNVNISLGNIYANPYPSFPTDLQSPILAYSTICKGDSYITDCVFRNRFSVADELIKMGAEIEVTGSTAHVKGVDLLHGERVIARDLRGGAALVIAGLVAEGETIIENAEIIDRGYYEIEKSLSDLGADIRRDRLL